MKKVMMIVAAMVLLMTGCQPEKDEWSRFYGFTKADIVGNYIANPDESCYEDYPVEDVTTHRNAQVDVIDLGGDLVEVRVAIPNVIHKSYTGVVGTEGHDTEIIFSDYSDNDLVLDVYKNTQNQVRLHGRVRQVVTAGILTKVDVFDVVKK